MFLFLSFLLRRSRSLFLFDPKIKIKKGEREKGATECNVDVVVVIFLLLLEKIIFIVSKLLDVGWKVALNQY